MSNDLVFVPSNLLEQREREREQIRSGIKKVSINGGDDRQFITRQRTCCCLRGASRISQLVELVKATGYGVITRRCVPRRDIRPRQTRGSRLTCISVNYPLHPLHFLSLSLSFESNEKITLNTSRKSLSQLCLLTRAKYSNND